jgi:hypothetical protein
MATKPKAPKPMARKSTTKPVPLPKKTATAKPKKPTLNDYLKQGKRPPLAPGQKKLPSDADVIIKGYNDPATIKKYGKKKK